MKRRSTECIRRRGRAAAAERLEPRTLCATLEVTVGDGAPAFVGFTDADGTATTVSLSAGTATVRLGGEALARAPQGKGVVVTGQGVTLDAIEATGTTPGGRLQIKSDGGDGRVAVGEVTVAAPLTTLSAPSVVLRGPLSLSAGARAITLLRTEGAIITIGTGARPATSIAITEAAVDTDLSSAARVDRLAAGEWIGTDAEPDIISAGSVGRLVIDHGFTGEVMAGSVGSMSVGGDLANSGIRLTQPFRRGARSLGTLRAGFYIRDSIITSAGSIGQVRAAVLFNARIYAAVRELPDGLPLPSTTEDFTAPASIGRVHVSNITNISVVSAHSLGKIYLGVVGASFPPKEWGVAADEMALLTTLDGQGHAFRSKNLKGPVVRGATPGFKIMVF